MELPFMQQSVLIAAMRGADGVNKMHPSKYLGRWLRRCIVISAFDRKALDDPYYPGGGSYTGPSVTGDELGASTDWEKPMNKKVKAYMDSMDEIPLHYHLHLLHAVEILGYKHSNERVRAWWLQTYKALAHDMHLAVETEEQLNARLNDNESDWRKDETRFKK